LLCEKENIRFASKTLKKSQENLLSSKDLNLAGFSGAQQLQIQLDEERYEEGIPSFSDIYTITEALIFDDLLLVGVDVRAFV